MTFLRKVVLYGQLVEKMGANVTAKNNNSHVTTRGPTVHSMTGWIDEAKYQSPIKNRPSDNCKRRGSAATISNTFHFARAGYRKHRIRRRTRGEASCVAKNSRNHCFTSIPYDAAIRLRMRLANHVALIMRFPFNGVNSGRVNAGMVLLKNPPLVLKLLTCWETWSKI